MTIWGRRDGEAPDEEAQESQAEAHGSQAEARDTQEPATEYQAGEHQAGEPAPAFWRAQGQAQESLGRDPADAPPPAYGDVPPAGPEAAADGEQASREAPAPAMDEAPAGSDAPAPVLSSVVVDTETAVKGPPGAEQPAVAPESAATALEEPTVAVAHEPVVTEAQEPAITGSRDEAQEPATIAPQRWSEIMVAFVDDPRGSVKMAADAVDEAIEEFVDSVRARQRDLTATWQSAGADTEQLRTALREYRKLGQQVQQLDLGEKTGV